MAEDTTRIGFLADGDPTTDIMNRPGESGDSVPWEGWSHVREYVQEVPGRAA